MWPRQHGGQDPFREEEEEEEEEVEDHTPLPELAPEFVEKMQALKWAIYEGTVLKPEENTPEAQENELLSVYQAMLMRAYRLLQRATQHPLRPTNTDVFPSDIRPLLSAVGEWLVAFSKGKSVSDLIPYTHYLEQSLTVFPFVHRRHVGGEGDIEAQ